MDTNNDHKRNERKFIHWSRPIFTPCVCIAATWCPWIHCIMLRLARWVVMALRTSGEEQKPPVKKIRLTRWQLLTRCVVCTRSCTTYVNTVCAKSSRLNSPNDQRSKINTNSTSVRGRHVSVCLSQISVLLKRLNIEWRKQRHKISRDSSFVMPKIKYQWPWVSLNVTFVVWNVSFLIPIGLTQEI